MVDLWPVSWLGTVVASDEDGADDAKDAKSSVPQAMVSYQHLDGADARRVHAGDQTGGLGPRPAK